ncbi:hypothetical protein MYX82_10370 [Acidobacteria bacterium AH-259-D05]|nr:hypothetical protein [Acidobacteria bacterium AH-259-D05]
MILVVFLFPLLSGVCGFILGEEGELLILKPHPQDLKYNLTIQAHSEVDTNQGHNQGSIFEDHNDIMALRQKVSEAKDGLLEIELTVQEINWEEHGATSGKRFKREEIIGNTHRAKINLLGKIEEVESFPHFASREFYRESLDGPPMDHWRIMTMLYPQFPLNLVRKGQSWEIEDEFSIRPAEALAIAGIMPIRYDLEMVVKRTIKYTLVDYLQKMGYRTARIGFEAIFRTDGEVHGAEEGDYTEGNGKSSGEFYFAPEEGILVEATFKESVVERRARDGHFRYWISRDQSVFAEAYDQTSIPLIWRTDKTVRFALVKQE